MSRLTILLLTLSTLISISAPLNAQKQFAEFGQLTAGRTVYGFRAEAVYLDESDRPIGARFRHINTGFLIDLLQIQSVPQAYIYTNTFLVSDMGEPHTQEHLLIAKGNKGRNINVAEGMSLTGATASTYPTYTNYSFNTAGGPEVFYQRFAEYMDVLLHPDYKTEEVVREVRNWGVAENPDKTLKIEEKGSVYNEMTSSMNNPDWRVYFRSTRMLFGEAHPLSFNPGGSPEGIRQMTAADIKKYHDNNYHLANMGAVISLPKSMTLGSALPRLDSILAKAEPGGGKRAFTTFDTLPAVKPAKPGAIEIVDYPSEDAQAASTIFFTLPGKEQLDMTSRVLLTNFLTVFAGDPSSNLYKRFIDAKTRQLNTGAKGMYSFFDDIPTPPVYIALQDVPGENLNAEMAGLMQQSITAEMRRIAAFKDGSPELKEFNERFRNALTEHKRSLSKFVNTPPGFGFRSGGNGDLWLWRTRHLNDEPVFRKSITLKPQLAEVEALLASPKNFWSDRLSKWGFTTTPPYAAVARPNPKLTAEEESARKVRAAAEIAELKKQFKINDDQEAIRRYKASYDKTTAELEALQDGVKAKFIENPPLTLDDQLEYRESTVGKVKVGESIFDNMSGATSGISLRLDTVPEQDLVYASAMPHLLRGTGVIKDGKALTFEEMSQMLRREILSLSVDFTGSAPNNRYELTVRGAGNDPAESERAVDWMNLILRSPNWTQANLPRVRDVVDQQLSALRRRMQDAEETWVTIPADAYAYQDRPLQLSTFSFLTQAHNFFRLKWMLKDDGGVGIDKFLSNLGQAKASRDELQGLSKALQGDSKASADLSPGLKIYVDQKIKLSEAEQALVVEAAKDLAASLSDIPDSTLETDWQYLTAQMRKGLSQGPTRTLERLNSLRAKLLNLNKTRMFYIGSTATRQRLGARFASLLDGLDSSESVGVKYSSARAIDERVSARTGDSSRPIYVGLLAQNMSGGVIINSAPVAGYRDTGRDKILDFLTTKLYSGYGPHAVFTKTINAGLAYSNGISSSPDTGKIRYYAERTPLLPQTLGFVVSEVKRPMNVPLVDYVTALAFNSRAASTYEARGEAMAANMADGVTPEVVATFRRAILAAGKMPNVGQELWARKDKIYEKVLPGYGVKGRGIEGGTFFVIGPEKQLSAYEAYVKGSDGEDTRLFRLYPRDFWMIDR